MPSKAKAKRERFPMMVEGVPVTVTLTHPFRSHKSFYIYREGWTFSKSTHQTDRQNALRAAEAMLKNPDAKQPDFGDLTLSDKEFIALQEHHFGRKTDPEDKKRGAKSLKNCLEAIKAFKRVTGLTNVASATADQCAKFETKALSLLRNWRHKNRAEDSVELVSPNTVVKWLRELQAAFERANRNAPKKKCVRGVVDERKLLSSNPWHQFTWIEGTSKKPRQFTHDELLSLLMYFETTWKEVTAGALACQVLLWSGSRKDEIASLTWQNYRHFENEHHFESVGKRGVRKWFRIPDALYEELVRLRTDSPFVFAAYSEQLRHIHTDNASWLQHVKSYTPARFGEWLYKKVKHWSEQQQGKPAYVHTFRKTAMQFARRGEDLNRQVADALRVSPSVMLEHYVIEGDAELRSYSNDTYYRIAAALPPEVARRYGHDEPEKTKLERQLDGARASKEWDLVNQLSARLVKQGRSEAV
jgi:hypothetical protein